MSVQAMAWALSQQEVTKATCRHVLLCLANYADQDGKAAFPSVARLTLDTGLSERTVRACLAELENCGAVLRGNQRIVAAHIDRIDRRPVCYDLPINRGAAHAGRSKRGADDAGTGCSSCTDGVQLMQERGATAAPKPSYKPSIEPPYKPYMGDASHSPPASAQDVDSKRQRKGHPLPANFQPNAEHKALADQLGLSLQTEQALFVDHHKAKGGTSQDWNASFRSWLRRAERFKGKTGNKKGYFRTDSADVDYWDGVTPDGRF